MRRVSVLFLACVLAIGCTPKPASSLQAPNFQLKDLSGNTVSLDSYKGHPILLDFWATWCGPCRISIPNVEAFYNKHKDQGFVVLSLNMDDDTSHVFEFVKQFGMTYPVLYAASSTAASDYQMDGIPLFVLIAPDGHVIDRYDGYGPELPGRWETEFAPFLTKKKEAA